MTDDYPELLAVLRPLVKACGMTMLNTHPHARIYNESSNRLILLIKIRDWLKSRLLEFSSVISGFEADLQTDIRIYESLKAAYSHFPNFSRAYPTSAFLTSASASFSNTVHTYSELMVTLDSEIDFVSSMLTRLDIYISIDHRDSDESVGDLLKCWCGYTKERPAKVVRDYYFYITLPAAKDDATRMLVDMTRSMRRAYIVQRIGREFDIRSDQGWFFVFDTLTLSDDRLRDFYRSPNALRDYFRNVGRAVLKAEGRSTKGSSSDCYRYFCAPEYGGRTGRLHFHVVHMLRTLPKGVYDPTRGGRFRGRVEISLFKGMWSYGHTSPIAVRYANDAFTRRLGWVWPLDRSGKARQTKPLLAIARYVAKYVSKADDLSVKRGVEKWKKYNLQLQLVPPALFRVRMSRGFGTDLPSMEHLEHNDLIQLMHLDSSLARYRILLRQSARRELKRRLGVTPLFALLDARPETVNLLKLLRRLTEAHPEFKGQSFIPSMTQTLSATDVSNGVAAYVRDHGFTPLPPSGAAIGRVGPK